MAVSYKIMFLVILPMLISVTYSLECTNQTLTNKSSYTKCTDLPYLSAYLHWTYDAAKSSLSIAFIAPPSKPDGWISWAINPTATGMEGSQALIAFKDSNGSLTVKTYNITSYGPISESKIAYNVSGTKAESDGKVMKLYATLTLPEKMTKVNQVWQVGGAVKGGVPQKHEFASGNLNAKAGLDLVSGSPTSSPPAISPAMAPPTNPAKAPAPSAGLRITSSGFISLMLFVSTILL